MALDPGTDRQLVHDAARHANPVLFRLLATECSLPGGAGFPAKRFDEEGSGGFQGGATAQSGSGRNGRKDGDSAGCKGHPMFSVDAQDSYGIVEPGFLRFRPGNMITGGKFSPSAALFRRPQFDFAGFRAWSCEESDPRFDRRWHDPAIKIVNVLTNQIDPTWCLDPQDRIATKPRPKLIFEANHWADENPNDTDWTRVGA